MKKIFAALFLVVFASTILLAQDPTDKKFHFGLKATPGIFWMKAGDETITSNGLKLGFGYGLITEFRLAENYAFATGIEVAGLGGKFTQLLTATTGTVTTTINNKQDVKLQYLQIPLALKMKTKQIGAMKYFGQFGLGAAFNLKATSDYSYSITGQPTVTKDDADIQKSINPIRLALVVGGGVEYNLAGSTSLLVSAHFDNGFLNIMKKNTTDNPDQIKVLSKGIVLTVGILF